MSELDGKLQIRPGQRIAVVGSGPDLEISAEPAAPAVAEAVLVFARDRAELEPRLPMLADVATRGGIAWLAYPKARRLGTDLSRDVIRAMVPAAGLDPVRQVSLDSTWSALRMKPVPPAH